MVKNSYILLWLESPLQSWGDNAKFTHKQTLNFPTKSAVLGIILASMGRKGEQHELLKAFSSTDMQVYAFSRTKEAAPKLFDFQTIGSGYNRSDKFQNLCIPKKSDGKNGDFDTSIIHKYYLQDAIFAVALEVPNDYLDEVMDGLKQPVYSVFLGRKNCVPTEFIFQGVFAEQVQAKQHSYELAQVKNIEPKFEVIQGIHSSNPNCVKYINDVPLQFGKIKKYTARTISIV